PMLLPTAPGTSLGDGPPSGEHPLQLAEDLLEGAHVAGHHRLAVGRREAADRNDRVDGVDGLRVVLGAVGDWLTVLAGPGAALAVAPPLGEERHAGDDELGPPELHALRLQGPPDA